MTKANGQMKVVIEDNGIGREKAAALKTKSGSTDRSYGIGITKQRLENISKNNKIIITDLIDNGVCWGTKVELLIDINKNQKESHEGTHY
jgi:nitrate/nitrite-specific signal transduction histidine kinase